MGGLAAMLVSFQVQVQQQVLLVQLMLFDVGPSMKFITADYLKGCGENSRRARFRN